MLLPAVAALVTILAAPVCAGHGERVPQTASACHRTTDGKEVAVWRCMGGQHGGKTSAAVDPFIVFDAYRATAQADLGGGFPAHPHRGFDELRYLWAGSLHHTDSCGTKATTRAGGVQLLRTGRGIAHEEAIEAATMSDAQREALEDARHGATHGVDPAWLFAGVQVWVNVPGANKSHPPLHRSLAADAFPVVRRKQPKPHNAPPAWQPPTDSVVKVLSGAYGGHRGPLSNDTSHILFLDVEHLLPHGRPVEVAFGAEDDTALVYVYRGSVLVGAGEDASVVDAGQLAVLTRGFYTTLAAAEDEGGVEGPASALVLGAPRVREPVFLGSGFVTTSRTALDDAMRDLERGTTSKC